MILLCTCRIAVFLFKENDTFSLSVNLCEAMILEESTVAIYFSKFVLIWKKMISIMFNQEVKNIDLLRKKTPTFSLSTE